MMNTSKEPDHSSMDVLDWSRDLGALAARARLGIPVPHKPPAITPSTGSSPNRNPDLFTRLLKNRAQQESTAKLRANELILAP